MQSKPMAKIREKEVSKIITFDIDILDNEQIIDEDYVYVFNTLYKSIRTNGAMIQIYHSPRYFDEFKWLVYPTDGVSLHKDGISLPVGKWLREGLEQGDKIRVVFLSGE